MTRAIFQRELLDAIVSRKLLWICILCFVPIPLSTLVNQRAQGQLAAYLARAQVDYEQSLAGMKAADQVEVRAFRDKPPLSSLAFGLESVLPNTVSLRRDVSRGTMLRARVLATTKRLREAWPEWDTPYLILGELERSEPGTATG